MMFASGNFLSGLESHFEDFIWLCAISTERVTALAVFWLTTSLGFLSIAACESLQWDRSIPYLQSTDSLFVELCMALYPKQKGMNVEE